MTAQDQPAPAGWQSAATVPVQQEPLPAPGPATAGAGAQQADAFLPVPPTPPANGPATPTVQAIQDGMASRRANPLAGGVQVAQGASGPMIGAPASTSSQDAGPAPIDVGSLPPGPLNAADYAAVVARNQYLAGKYDPSSLADKALNLVTGAMADPVNVLTSAQQAEHQGLSAKIAQTLNPPLTPDQARLDTMVASPMGAAASGLVQAAGGSQKAQDLALGLGAAADGIGLSIAGTRAGQATEFLNAQTGESVPIVPNGFTNDKELSQFATNMQKGLTAAGYPDAQLILQGSAVTGSGYNSGQPFDVGRTSDFDVAVASASLLQAAIDAGVGTRSGGTRTGPLDKDALNALGLSDVANKMSQQAGRPVKFMIFSNPNDAVAKAPSISLTGK